MLRDGRAGLDMRGTYPPMRISPLMGVCTMEWLGDEKALNTILYVYAFQATCALDVR